MRRADGDQDGTVWRVPGVHALSQVQVHAAGAARHQVPPVRVGDLAERRTKRGRTFYGCLRYPDCDYSTWNKPVPVPCPNCGFVGMEQLKSKTTGETTRKCLKCGHQMAVEEAAPEAEEVAS